MVETLKALRFLIVGPMILVLLFVINLMTSPGHWWVQWAALGIGIVWVISLFRVLGAVAVIGGLAALGAWLMRRRTETDSGPPPPPPPKY
jgi:membrane-bound ClpP family serine protease